VQPDATQGNPLESLPTKPPDQAPLLSADAAECTPATDAGLTPAEASANQALARLPDDRLLTVSEAASYLGVSKLDIYEACDRGRIPYVRFEGTVQVEVRDLKAWAKEVIAPSRPAGDDKPIEASR
jgi:excisionase family DNA binding protein